MAPIDFNSSFDFTSDLGYELVTFSTAADPRDYYTGIGLLAPDRSVRVSFVASPEAVTVTYDASSASFAGSDRVPAGDFRFYRTTAAATTIGYNPSRYRAKYVTAFQIKTSTDGQSPDGVAGTVTRYQFGFAGSSTSPSDTLRPTLSYEGSNEFYGGTRSDVIYPFFSESYVTIDGNVLASNSHISFRETLGGSSILLPLSGTFDRSTGRLSGTLRDNAGRFSGTFRGRVFGPQAAEIAIVFEVTRASDGAKFTGDFVGSLP